MAGKKGRSGATNSHFYVRITTKLRDDLIWQLKYMLNELIYASQTDTGGYIGSLKKEVKALQSRLRRAKHE